MYAQNDWQMIQVFITAMLQAGGFRKDLTADDQTKANLDKLEKIIRAYYIKSYYVVAKDGVVRKEEITSGLNTGDRFTTWFNSLTAYCNILAATGWCIENEGLKVSDVLTIVL